jgi:CBS domain containing-hemolysin-like protein
VRQLEHEHAPGAGRLLSLKQNMSRPIAAIVVLNNVANIVGSMLVGAVAADVLGETWLGLFSALLTAAIIVLAEIVPKTLGTRYAEPVGLVLAGPLLLLARLMTPLLWLLEHLTAALSGPDDGASVDEHQITFLTRQGRSDGTIDADESEMIQRVFLLDDHTARDIMTPRTRMTWVRSGQPLANLHEQLPTLQHSRIVVVGETLDEIVGVVLLRDALVGLLEDPTTLLDGSFAGLVQPQFVPVDIRADRLLDFFLESRQHLALVRDEFGQVQGIVTLEDVLEILTGEIVDETDRDVDLQEAARQGVP